MAKKNEYKVVGVFVDGGHTFYVCKSASRYGGHLYVNILAYNDVLRRGCSIYNLGMKEKVYKVYVITLSRTFPTTHPKAGEQTGFGENLRKTKLHTIRGNYELWERRFKQVEAGEACISIRQWTGRPYASKQVEIANLKKEDGIGIQKLNFYHGMTPDALFYPTIDGKPSDSTELAHNDGLTLKDWRDWFKKSDLSKPMVIIHFTGFRY